MKQVVSPSWTATPQGARSRGDSGVFAAGLIVVAAALLVVLFIPRVPLRDRSPMGAQASEGDDTVIPAEAHL